MEQVLIFANPIAGRGRGKAIAVGLRDCLARAGYDVSLFLSKADSVAFAKPKDNIRAAVVIGGDGTLRGVSQWAIDSFADGRDDADPTAACLPYPLLIVPMGTANLMGKHLGISWDHKRLDAQVLAAIERHRIVHLDVARTHGGVFLLMASVGFDAWVVHELGRIRKGPIDMTTYVLPTLKALTEYRFPTITVTVDGKRVFNNQPGLAIAGNVREYGTGFPLLPHARPDDQLLDVCVMPCASRGQLIKIAMAAVAGEHDREEGVVYMKGRHVVIESPEQTPVQVDGEPAGMTPVDISLLAGRIPFIVPEC